MPHLARQRPRLAYSHSVPIEPGRRRAHHFLVVNPSPIFSQTNCRRAHRSICRGSSTFAAGSIIPSASWRASVTRARSPLSMSSFELNLKSSDKVTGKGASMGKSAIRRPTCCLDIPACLQTAAPTWICPSSIGKVSRSLPSLFVSRKTVSKKGYGIRASPGEVTTAGSDEPTPRAEEFNVFALRGNVHGIHGRFPAARPPSK